MDDTTKTTPAKEKPTKEKLGADQLKLKTSGAFMLVDPFSGAEFIEDEPTITAKTPFVTERLESGDLVEA
jgi:hypothetical protein